MEMPRCAYLHAHDQTVSRVREGLPGEAELYELSELYKVFGDPTRLRILYVLFESDMCVCDLALLLQMGQSAVSHHLRVLKQAKLVTFRRDGKAVIYALADDHVRRILDQGMEHVKE